MCFDYDDQADIFESSQVKCRKPHKCLGCKQMIAKGDRAECCSGLFDGAWFRFYVCDRCKRVQMAIVAKELKEGCPWHSAWIAIEDLREYQAELRQYGDEVQPLEMETLSDCMAYLNQVYEEVKLWKRSAV